ncbi:MAG TPA: amino acid adenylation domain-containing protein, partial [Pyrinomonadaceae bacterium]|nr:amino acid adenylation domain-containing protein [Pyrinomonadaceae bacterium]
MCYESERYTYAELNTRANRLARYLQKFGVGPEILVGICVERSLDTVVGILGILKAGGAYVPLDPAYPKERLGFMIQDSQVKVLVTHQHLVDDLPESSATVIYLDVDHIAIAQESGESVSSGVQSSGLAYVIYTSGSTGNPKGVLITHHNVVRLLQATDKWFEFNETDVWTMFHSYSFDFSVWEMWGAFAYGGRLVIVPFVTSRSPRDFYNMLSDQGVTVLNQTPSAFKQLIYAEGSGQAKDLALRYVIFGGEALEFQSLRPWVERHGIDSPQLINMYGITETTVHVTFRRLSIDDIRSPNGSLIGSRIPDLGIYILDKRLRPTPIDVAGEMYISGAGLARGYLNRPTLTDERFIANPFSADIGSRLYKTGDLARYVSSGEIEYLGRIDNQVKVRGFRIELGEIEFALSQIDAVRECVVIAADDDAGGKRLVAYIVPAGDHTIDAAEMRHTLKRSLPDYMIPSAFVPIASVPLTSNGKTDVKALPPAESLAVETRDHFV